MSLVTIAANISLKFKVCGTVANLSECEKGIQV